MSNQQPEALRLAAQLKDRFGATVPTSQAAAKLIHQHAEIERLRAELAALQEDLRYVAHSGMGSCAKVHAAPAGWQLVPVEPTSKKHCETCANEPLSASSTPCEVCCLAPFGQYPSWTPKGGE